MNNKRYRLLEMENASNHRQFVLNFPKEVFDRVKLSDQFIEFKIMGKESLMLIPVKEADKKNMKTYAVCQNKAKTTIRLTIPRVIIGSMGFRKGDLFEFSIAKQGEGEVILLNKVEDGD